jgi:hypothetical protein
VDFDAVIFDPMSSTILKWLRFRVVSWGHDFQLCTAMVWDCLIVGLLLELFVVRLLWLHHIQSLAYVTMATIACNDVWRESRCISSSQNLLLESLDDGQSPKTRFFLFQYIIIRTLLELNSIDTLSTYVACAFELLKCLLFTLLPIWTHVVQNIVRAAKEIVTFLPIFLSFFLFI